MLITLIIIFFAWCFISAVITALIVIFGSMRSNPSNKILNPKIYSKTAQTRDSKDNQVLQPVNSSRS